MKLTSSASFSPSIRISLRLKIHQAQAKNFCRVLDIRVPQVVDSDALHPGLLGSPVHLVVQVALGHLKDPLVWLDFVEGFQIVSDLVRQKLRHLDDPDTLGCFRIGDHIPAFQPLIGFGDGEQPLVQVEVCRSQSQQLALPDATPVEHFKRIVGLRLVHHDFCEFEVLFFCPEEHLLVLF